MIFNDSHRLILMENVGYLTNGFEYFFREFAPEPVPDLRWLQVELGELDRFHNFSRQTLPCLRKIQNTADDAKYCWKML